MNIRKTLLAATVAAALGLPVAASAITIDGITFEPGAIIETADIFEGERDGGAILAPGDELIGIGIVNRILDAGNNVLWQNGDNGRELTIYFYDYIAQDFSSDVVATNGVDTITFSGGLIEIYSDSAEDFSAAGSIQDGIDSATNGNLWLSLAGSPTGGFDSATGSEAITLTSVGIRPANSPPFESAFNLTGTGLLDVTGGLAEGNFDTDTFLCSAISGAPCPDDADKSFTSSGQLPVGGVGMWAFRGTGEVQDFAVPVPAPLLLLGAGIAALGYGSRRKAKAVA